MEKTLFEEISDTYPNMNNTEIRNVLAAFLFTGDDVYKRIQDLSGGERGRVSLAKAACFQKPISSFSMSRPTIWISLPKRFWNNALNQYEGTVLYVSHDRYFINQTATRILELTGNTLVNYIGNYDYYLEKKEELTAIYVPGEAASAVSSDKTETDSKLDWQQQKELQAKERKRKNALKKTEDQISALEDADAEIDALMAALRRWQRMLENVSN